MLHRNFVTPIGRASWCSVFEKTELLNGDMAYTLTILIPKTDTAGIKFINAAINSAAIAYFGENKNKWPKGMKSPLRDGDTEDKGDAYLGHMFISTKTNNQPGIVDANVKPILDPEEFYSGCYCRASVNMYGYDKGGNKGVGVGLNNVMKTGDGERLDGRKSAENDFSAFASTEEHEVGGADASGGTDAGTDDFLT